LPPLTCSPSPADAAVAQGAGAAPDEMLLDASAGWVLCLAGPSAAHMHETSIHSALALCIIDAWLTRHATPQLTYCNIISMFHSTSQLQPVACR
jgi:hypothetical protein